MEKGSKKGKLTNGWDEGRIESIFRKPEEDARLADPWVTNQQQFEQIIIRLRHTLCFQSFSFFTRSLSHLSPWFLKPTKRSILGIPMTHPLNLNKHTRRHVSAYLDKAKLVEGSRKGSLLESVRTGQNSRNRARKNICQKKRWQPSVSTTFTLVLWPAFWPHHRWCARVHTHTQHVCRRQAESSCEDALISVHVKSTSLPRSLQIAN